MKLSEFLPENNKVRSSGKKIITVSNEKLEHELMEKVDALTMELTRVRDVDKENHTLLSKVREIEGRLEVVMQSEQELIQAKGILQISVTEGDTIRSNNQRLQNELKELTNQLGVKEAILDQSQKNNLELNLMAETLTTQLKDLEVKDDEVKSKLEESLQQTTTSVKHLTQMHEKLNDTYEMFQSTEVKYKEEQRKNSGLTREVIYWTSVANTLQEERDELEQTRQMLKELATNVEADNVETKGAVRVTQGELKKLRGTVGTMTANMDNLIQENQRLSEFNSALKAELSRPKYMSMTAIQHSEGFKLPTGGYRKHFLGNSKPTLLKFKREDNHDN